MKRIIAIDPGNKTGITWGDPEAHYDEWQMALIDFTPKKATKSRPADKEHERFGRLYAQLCTIYNGMLMELASEKLHDPNARLKVYCVCEDAEGFMRGKSAVKTSHSYRGVIKAFCYMHQIEFIEIQPNDLKYFVTGKRSAEKEEMIGFARRKYGYAGNDDNVADSIHLFAFGVDYLNKFAGAHTQSLML